MKTIAVIDDDLYIGDMLQEVLTKEGYAVIRAYSGTEALLLLKSRRPDLVLLDLMLPGLSGEDVLPHIKNIPVIIISAKGDPQDKAGLLLSGAADYITKPFDTAELLARITVQLRGSPGAGSLITFRNLSIDTDSHQVFAGKTPLRLTKTEYAIFKLLMLNPGRVITKSVMLDSISPDTPDCVESSLKVHISNLRKKLRDAGGYDCIESVWGIGFKLTE